MFGVLTKSKRLYSKLTHCLLCMRCCLVKGSVPHLHTVGLERPTPGSSKSSEALHEAKLYSAREEGLHQVEFSCSMVVEDWHGFLFAR